MVSSLNLDPKTQSWQWENDQGRLYLTCALLQDWKHGFFSQQFYPNSPQDLNNILNPQGTFYRVKQVHGPVVLTPTEINQKIETETLETEYPPADGIISDAPDQSLWVASADCTPVLIGDVKTGVTAALHAGWRGTAQKIVPKAVSRFLSFGSRLEDLRIAMGPAIAGEVYQVGIEVAAEVGASLLEKSETDTPEAILEALGERFNSPILPDAEPGRVKLDVRRVNLGQLQQLGIDEEQIAIAPYCTYQQPEYFFSYRRTQEKKVQWSGIVSG